MDTDKALITFDQLLDEAKAALEWHGANYTKLNERQLEAALAAIDALSFSAELVLVKLRHA